MFKRAELYNGQGSMWSMICARVGSEGDRRKWRVTIISWLSAHQLHLETGEVKARYIPRPSLPPPLILPPHIQRSTLKWKLSTYTYLIWPYSNGLQDAHRFSIWSRSVEPHNCSPCLSTVSESHFDATYFVRLVKTAYIDFGLLQSFSSIFIITFSLSCKSLCKVLRKYLHQIRVYCLIFI